MFGEKFEPLQPEYDVKLVNETVAILAATRQLNPWREWDITIPYGPNEDDYWGYREQFERWMNDLNSTGKLTHMTASVVDKPISFDVILVGISNIEMYWNGSGDPHNFIATFKVNSLF